MSIWFFSGRAELDATEALKITTLAARARADPGLEFGINRSLRGRVTDPFSDSVPDESTDRLGPQRLTAIREAMVAAGVPANRIHVGEYGGRVHDIDRRTIIFVRLAPPGEDVPVVDGGVVSER